MLDELVTDDGEASIALDPPLGSARKCTFARISRWRLAATLQVAEALVVGSSTYIWLRDMASEATAQVGQLERLYTAVAVALVVHLIQRSLCAYDLANILRLWRSSVTAGIAWMLSTTTLLIWGVEVGSYSNLGRISLVDWLIGGACIVFLRLSVAYGGNVLIRTGRLTHNVAIIGSGFEAQCCAQYLGSDQAAATSVKLIAPEKFWVINASSERYHSQMSQLQTLIQSHSVDDVIVATSEGETARFGDLLSALLCFPVRVLFWPTSVGIKAQWLTTSGYKIGKMPLILASIPPLRGWRWVLKDVQDRFLAGLLLIICLPALLAIAAMVRVSSRGPILFRQEREGYNGHNFVIYKFRTMHVASREPNQLILTARQDPRVFPLGLTLRKTSLDELPQLFNVLRGDMWLVGPRPHSPLATAAGQRYAVAVNRYMSRSRVKPGITGWAQVNGWRGTTNTLEEIRQRVEYDLYYIENWSSWLDLKIVLRTAVKGFSNGNAY
jgi:Undecaprenyl-phosphate glucose phosphotransferase